MTDKKPEPDKVKEAQNILLEEENKSRVKCLEEVNAVLKKHGYGLNTVAEIQLVKTP